MTSGLRALAATATKEPLPFEITLFVGQMQVTGRVAPADWWYEISANARRAEVEAGMRKIRSQRDRYEIMEEYFGPTDDALRAARKRESDLDEVTLIDVQVFPAVGTQGIRSGGIALPVARVPYSSVDIWWIVEGATIRGSSGSQGTFGFEFLFPLS